MTDETDYEEEFEVKGKREEQDGSLKATVDSGNYRILLNVSPGRDAFTADIKRNGTHLRNYSSNNGHLPLKMMAEEAINSVAG